MLRTPWNCPFFLGTWLLWSSLGKKDDALIDLQRGISKTEQKTCFHLKQKKRKMEAGPDNIQVSWEEIFSIEFYSVRKSETYSAAGVYNSLIWYKPSRLRKLNWLNCRARWSCSNLNTKHRTDIISVSFEGKIWRGKMGAKYSTFPLMLFFLIVSLSSLMTNSECRPDVPF